MKLVQFGIGKVISVNIRTNFVSAIINMIKVSLIVAPIIPYIKNKIRHYNTTINRILNQDLTLALLPIHTRKKQRKGVFATTGNGVMVLVL